MYDVKITPPTITVRSLMKGDMENFWASNENTAEFNHLIPSFKSLHRDMYSFIESLCRLRDGSYDYLAFENRFEYYKQFRELNNKFKHPEKKSIQVVLTKVVMIFDSTFELYCNFIYDRTDNIYVPYSGFIILFYDLLLHLKAIELRPEHEE
ncbi:MAG: hypothetical protein ABI378_07465 [Chitinophagaceae bacterium]